MEESQSTLGEPMTDNWKYDPEFHRMAEFLGIDKYDRDNVDIAKKMSLVRDWAGAKTKKNSLEESLLQVNKLRKELGLPFQGKDLLNHLYQTVRLDMDRRKSTEEAIKKPRAAKREAKSSLKDTIATSVKDSITNMVKKTVSDKKLIGKTIQNVISETIK